MAAQARGVVSPPDERPRRGRRAGGADGRQPARAEPFADAHDRRRRAVDQPAGADRRDARRHRHPHRLLQLAEAAFRSARHLGDDLRPSAERRRRGGRLVPQRRAQAVPRTARPARTGASSSNATSATSPTPTTPIPTAACCSSILACSSTRARRRRRGRSADLPSSGRASRVHLLPRAGEGHSPSPA